MQLDDVQFDKFSFSDSNLNKEFHEFVLEERGGRERLIYARQCRLKELLDFIKDLKEVHRPNYLQLRYVFE